MRFLVGPSFGEQHFGRGDFGHAARTKAIVASADAVCKHPGSTLPDKFASPAALNRFYRLMNNQHVTHGKVLEAHAARVIELASLNGDPVLFIHDSTQLDYTGLKSLKGVLGPIGNGSNQRGYICHNTLAVRAGSREVLGLAAQQLHKRPRRKVKRTKKQVASNPRRESRLWKKGSQAIPDAPAGCRWIEICDRGADITEYIDHMDETGRQYVVRSTQNRRITRIENGLVVDGKLHDYARSQPLLGSREINVPARDRMPPRKGKPAVPAQAARTAELGVSWSEVTIQSPRQKRGEERGVELRVWVVRVAERNPPAGAVPVEWILITNCPVKLEPQAWESVDWYSQRWIIEEYHKVQKTGLGIEDLQFTREHSLDNAIAFLSVIAISLLQLRNASRRDDAKTRLATDLYPVLLVIVIALWRYKTPRRDLTVHEFFYAVARLGGHQNRKRDLAPGWLVLWRGWTKLQTMMELANQQQHLKTGES